MTRRRPTLLDDWFVITFPPEDSAGLPSHLPQERRNPASAPSAAPNPPQDASGPSGDRCRYGLFTTCSTCGPFNECQPGRLQRFLERRSLIGMARRWGQ